MDWYSTSTALALMPTLATDVPFIGYVDITPYVAAAVVFIGVNVVFKLVQVLLISRLKALSQKTSTDIDDVVIDALEGVRSWVLTIVAAFIALQLFALPEWADLTATAFVSFAIAWQAIEVFTSFVEYGARRLLEKDEDGDGEVDPNAATMSDLVKLIARIVLWALGGIFILSNLGIEVTSLVAGLGIGGVAVAFALQGVLSDLFASFSIYFDKPFRVGDFITIGSDMGTVEKIGIKSTRIKTLQGEELVVSNAELTGTRVQNFKKMQERRGVVQFGVTYDTPYEKVVGINETVRQIFNKIDTARLDRVHFTTFADSSLLYEVVYYVNTSDYYVFLDAQQRFNHELMEAFAKDSIEFAFPTQTIYTKSLG